MLTTFDLVEYLFEALRAGFDELTPPEREVLAKLGVRDRVHAVLVAYEGRY